MEHKGEHMISEFQKPLESLFHAKSEPSEVLHGIDLSNKTVIITGGYSGIGLETTKAILKAGAKVILPCRRLDEANKNLDPNDKNLILKSMDLSSIESIEGFSAFISNENMSIDILINNAGIMACPETRIGDGWESQFGVNHLGHFFLLKKLIPFFNDGARFVSLSSTAHIFSPIRWDDIHFTQNSYDKWIAYGQSKTASSLIAVHFNELMSDKNIHGYAVHPGGIFTPLQRHLQNEEMVALGWLKEDGSPSDLALQGFKTPSQGATTTLWAATSPMLKNIGGIYCENCNVAQLKSEFENPEASRYIGVADWAVSKEDAKKLWDYSEKTLEQWL